MQRGKNGLNEFDINFALSYTRRRVKVAYIGVARIFSGGAIFSIEKLDDLFLVVDLKTQAKTAKLTTPTLKISSAQQKCPQKFDSLLCWGVHLRLSPVNYVTKFFLRPRDARASSATLATPTHCIRVCVFFTEFDSFTGRLSHSG